VDFHKRSNPTMNLPTGPPNIMNHISYPKIDNSFIKTNEQLLNKYFMTLLYKQLPKNKIENKYLLTDF